jgi:hypothetical protein
MNRTREPAKRPTPSRAIPSACAASSADARSATPQPGRCHAADLVPGVGPGSRGAAAGRFLGATGREASTT